MNQDRQSCHQPFVWHDSHLEAVRGRFMAEKRRSETARDMTKAVVACTLSFWHLRRATTVIRLPETTRVKHVSTDAWPEYGHWTATRQDAWPNLNSNKGRVRQICQKTSFVSAWRNGWSRQVIQVVNTCQIPEFH